MRAVMGLKLANLPNLAKVAKVAKVMGARGWVVVHER
jgi:hypothetical protein